MTLALKEANKAREIDEVPIGCVIVKDNKVIARGHNLRESKQDPTLHAEMVAIRKASKKLKSWRLEGCDIYVTIEPCIMCSGAIIQSRIKKVVYGAKSYQDGAIESAIKIFETKGFNHYPQTLYLKDSTYCSKIISDYFKSKR